MPLKVDAITSVNGTSDAITIDANSQVTLAENLTVSKCVHLMDATLKRNWRCLLMIFKQIKRTTSPKL